MKKFKLFLILLMVFHFGVIHAQSNSIKQHSVQAKKHELKGKATYYGDNYKKTRKTANGDRFDKNAHTAAHKTLPFGTMVKVTNKRNGKSATVRINDRGPFGPGRVIDVTPKVASKLDMKMAGVVPCEIEIISMPESKKKLKG